MDILSALLYLSIVIVVYKVFKISVNKWNVTTTVLIGFFLLGSIFSFMAYYQPYSTQARNYFVSVQILSQVRGLVTKVGIEEAERSVKKGQMLYEIDPTPFEASLESARADLAFNQQRLADSIELYKQGAGRLYEVQLYQQNVDKAKAELKKAKFNLEHTVVRAPSDGIVTQMRVRRGMMSLPLNLGPLLNFIPDEKPIYGAAFRQIALKNIKPGFPVEAIFPALPGRVFRGRVTRVLSAIQAGELQGSGNLFEILPEKESERYLVFFELDKEILQYNLPRGSLLRVAVYSDKMQFLSIIRQILLRMASWKMFFEFEGI